MSFPQYNQYSPYNQYNQPNNPYYYHNNYPNYQFNNQYKSQVNEQAQLNKQKISLIQDQNSSNTIMCRILSELENLAIILGYKGKTYFGYYATIPNNYQHTINQIVFQMTIFESSYKNFVKNNPNKQYNFPNNLNFVNIVEIVNNWKNYLENKGRESNKECYKESIEYYDEFLNILTNNNLSKSFNKKFKELGKDSPQMTPSELRRVMNAGSAAICFTNEKYSDIEKEFMEKGDFKVNVVIGGNRKDNKFYNATDKYDSNFSKLKKELYENLYFMLGYLEKYVILNAYNNMIKPNYSLQINDSSIKKEDVFSKYQKYLNNFYDINNKIYEECDFQIPNQERNKIEKDINGWKIKITNIEIKRELDNAIKVICKDKEPKDYYS
jgi:hypothetical protein